MWLQRKAINNNSTTFTNEHDIGKAAVNDWTENYNATHGREKDKRYLTDSNNRHDYIAVKLS
jgi:hypothetical protein